MNFISTLQLQFESCNLHFGQDVDANFVTCGLTLVLNLVNLFNLKLIKQTLRALLETSICTILRKNPLHSVCITKGSRLAKQPYLNLQMVFCLFERILVWNRNAINPPCLRLV